MIVDSSTLILLAKAGLLDIFINNSKKSLVITNQVIVESTNKKSFDSKLIQQRVEERKVLTENPKDYSLYNTLLKDFNLGKGEAESIALASEKNDILLSDDKKAINACKIFNVRFTTAMNILVSLYQTGAIDKEKTKLIFAKLRKYGRYSEEILMRVKEDIK